MATIKSYSDLQQSKKLAEILPLDSADMHFVNDKHAVCVPYLEITNCSNPWLKGVDISPCWSLAELLSVLPEKYTELIKEGGMFRIIIKDSYMTCLFNNPVDACYEMILNFMN